ncbi:hypothetical protein ABPG74_000821 [Tetrahymena malaccensis]
MDNQYARQSTQQQDSQLQIYSQQSLGCFNLFDENNDNFQGFNKSQQNLSSTEDQDCTLFQDTSSSSFKNDKKILQNQLNRKRAFIDYDFEEKQQNSSDTSTQKDIQFHNQQGLAVSQINSTQFSQNFLERTQRFLRANKKFYIYMDLVVDLDFFQNYSDKQNYLSENKHNQLEKGLRYINCVIHRMDNKFIEVDLTFFPSNVDDIEYLLKILYSYGNKDLLETIKKLQIIWDNVQLTKKLILNQYQNTLFQQHYESRKAASNLKFKQLTEGLDQKKLIFYIRLSVNYEKQLYESDRVGYSPELYDVIAENSYAFKEYLKAYGYFDPRNTYFKLEQCINTTLHFLTSSTKALFAQQGYSSQKIEIKTIDKFTFPVEARARFFNLDQDYDTQHNLNFKYNDMLVTYEYIFEDPNIQSKFKMYRQIQQSVQSRAITLQNDEEIDDRPEYQELELFKRYYQDDADKLIEVGNKWFKKCGLVNIPQKKSKKANS